ncbi:MAG: zinc ABC transporter substrate-binding protein [Chloroflexi bacterium]|nr:MAG: zinc ABC transporter substrate-binding protein [Chloroflexota bacterium]
MTMHRLISILTILTVTFLLTSALASCSGTAAPDILTTSTILADVTRNVVGERLSVGSLLPIGTDPHSYQPTPQDTAQISESKVLVINGADYEHFLEPLLANVDGERTLIEASTGLRLRSDAENGNASDPHLWLDPNNMIGYVENIRDGLEQFDPASAEMYRTNTRTYITHLEELDAWINQQIAQIPPERRLLVTNHEAFGYFAERYGFTVVGTVIESFSSDASPSAQQMAALVDQIKLYEAPAIFLDASDNPSLARQIAAETGVKVVTDLHLESLTEGAPAATYIEMMKYNVTKIIEALQ